MVTCFTGDIHRKKENRLHGVPVLCSVKSFIRLTRKTILNYSKTTNCNYRSCLQRESCDRLGERQGDWWRIRQSWQTYREAIWIRKTENMNRDEGSYRSLTHHNTFYWTISVDTNVTARRSYANAVSGVVILFVRPSVCHTPVTKLNNALRIFWHRTKWQSLYFMTPTVVGIGDVPFCLKFALKVTHSLWKAPTSTDFRL